MFWGTKKEGNRHIIAIKDYTSSLKSMKEGSFYLPFDKEIYFKLLENNATKVDTLKELGKFIKASNKKKSDVLHFWEGLIAQGYTLINVEYAEEVPSIEKLCNNNTIKYVSPV